jgi:hypothetical protein
LPLSEKLLKTFHNGLLQQCSDIGPSSEDPQVQTGLAAPPAPNMTSEKNSTGEQNITGGLVSIQVGDRALKE